MTVIRAAATAVGLCLVTPAASAADQLMSASGPDHAWFIVDRSAAEPRFELHHYSRTTDGPHFTRGLPLPRMPKAMAVWGNQLWLIFEAVGPAEVFTVQVHRNPVLEVWQHEPIDRLRAVARLDTPGEIVDVAGTPEGLLVLLRPLPRSHGGPALESPRLMRLDRRRWQEVALPDGFNPTGGCILVSGGSRGRRILMLDTPTAAGVSAAHWRGTDGVWTRSDVRLASQRLLGATSVGPAIALVLGSADPERIEVAYLRPRQLVPLTGLDTPAGPWTVFGMVGGLSVVELSEHRELSIRRIDPVSGHVGASRPMSAQSGMTARILHRPLLFALAVTALMVVMFFRPEPGVAAVTLPPTQALMGPMKRLLAVGIDVGVSAGLTLIILRCPARDLLDLPLWSRDLGCSVPFLVTAGLTVLHSTLTEIATGRTLGKALLGGLVVSFDGSGPTARATLIRNGFKMLVLLIPVLAVVTLLSPNAQGLGDSLARTVVVTGARRATDAEPNDR